MVARLHNWVRFEVFAPDLGRPVTHRHKVLEVTRVTLDLVDRSVMLALINTELHANFDGLSAVRLQNVPLLSSDQEFEGRRISIVLKRGSSENLGLRLSVHVEILNQGQLLSWTILKHAHVPPEQTTVS